MLPLFPLGLDLRCDPQPIQRIRIPDWHGCRHQRYREAKIKPTGTAVGDTLLALLARAQYHVHRGELAIAVAELEQLSGYQVRN